MDNISDKHPNIITIINDDHGYWALGCYGNKEIMTPNLDRLAGMGICFDNMFCVSPVCSPARASILTGSIPSQHGIHDWIKENNSEKDNINYLENQTFYTDILSNNGYACGLSGKWHLGNSSTPPAGFTHWYALEGGSSPYYNAPMYRDGKLVYETEYITDLITNDALVFIREQNQKNTPFCLSINYTAPHSPWIDNHPQDIVDFYDNCPFESCKQESRHPWATNLTDQYLGNKEGLKGYFASITAMDANLGKILDSLQALSIEKDTLIFFTSDNGYSCGQHGFWGKGNGTFPLNMYENSVKVPAIISHPGHIPQGIRCDSLLSHYDFMPTLLDYIGLETPERENLPGHSFASLLTGGNVEEHKNVVIYDEYGPTRMIRTKEWKYVHRYPYGPNELYNLIADHNEKNNLIEDLSSRDVRESLKANLDEWFDKYVISGSDGTLEPVTGAGQINLSGIAGRGKKAFSSECRH